MTFELEMEDRPGPDPNGKLPDLRNYQREAKEKTREGYRAGYRQILVNSPTGSGKTVTAMDLLFGTIQQGKRGLFVCDREALIDQTSRAADSWGIDHGVVQAKHWRWAPEKLLQIASIQTIESREKWPDADVIIIDECHTIRKSVVEHRETFRGFLLGLTATPFTKGLGKIYPHAVNVATMHRLIDVERALVEIEMQRCEAPDMAGVKPGSDGEWTRESAAAEEMKIRGNVVKELIKEGLGELKGIIFGATNEYCQTIEQELVASHIPARAISYKTHPDERKQILRDFLAGRVRALVSIDMLAKGFDAPDVEIIGDAYPMRKSLSTVIQRWGRGLRLCPAINKTRCKILDFAGNSRRFWPDFIDFYFNGVATLDDGEKLDAQARKEEHDFEPKGCPSCSFKPFLKRCMRCGYEKPTAPVETEAAGVMHRVMIGKREAARDTYDLFQQIVAYTRKNIRVKAKQEKFARGRFKDITGDWPPFHWRLDATPDAEISSATAGKLKSLRIAWARGKGNQLNVGSKVHRQGDLIT